MKQKAQRRWAARRKRFAASMRRAVLWVGSAVPDTIGIAAVGAIGYGAWLAYQPAGFMTSGALVLAIVVLRSRNAPPAREGD